MLMKVVKGADEYQGLLQLWPAGNFKVECLRKLRPTDVAPTISRHLGLHERTHQVRPLFHEQLCQDVSDVS